MRLYIWRLYLMLTDPTSRLVLVSYYPADFVSVRKRQDLLLPLELGQPASLAVGRHDLRRRGNRREDATTAEDAPSSVGRGRSELRLEVGVDLNHIPRDLDSVLLPPYSARTTRPRLGRALVRQSPAGLRVTLVVHRGHRNADIDGRDHPTAPPPFRPVTLVELHLLDAGVGGHCRLARADAERVAAVAAAGPVLGRRLGTLRGEAGEARRREEDAAAVVAPEGDGDGGDHGVARVQG